MALKSVVMSAAAGLLLSLLVAFVAMPGPAQSHSLVRRDVQDKVEDAFDETRDALSRNELCMTSDGCLDFIEECDMGRCKFQTWFLVVVVVIPIVLLISLLVSCLCCPCCCLYTMCRKS